MKIRRFSHFGESVCIGFGRIFLQFYDSKALICRKFEPVKLPPRYTHACNHFDELSKRRRTNGSHTSTYYRPT